MVDVVIELAPRVAAGAVLLVGAIGAIHRNATQSAGGGRRALPQGGARLVLLGCYAVALLVLLSPVVPAPLLPRWAQWCGVACMVLGLRWRLKPAPPWFEALGDVLLWTGVAAAAASLPLWSALLVSLIAAHAVRAAEVHSS